MSFPIVKPEDAIFSSLDDIHHYLSMYGCKACDLGFQPSLNGCCVSRGNPLSRRMIIGEAPGKYEDALSSPFTGPAGQLLDRILASVSWSDHDWYLTNIVLCRPIAPKGSGKENYTPKMEQRRRCRPYLDMQIKMIKPNIILTLGKPAAEAILGPVSSMGSIRGKSFLYQDIPVFPMLHPAAILHASSRPEKYELYREQTWEDIQKLRKIVDEENL